MSEERTNCLEPSGSQSVFYHGSPIEIDDVALASGTWLTGDIDLAREYGEFVYEVEVPDEHSSVIDGPNWEGHYVTRGHIPLGYLNLIENVEDGRGLSRCPAPTCSETKAIAGQLKLAHFIRLHGLSNDLEDYLFKVGGV